METLKKFIPKLKDCGKKTVFYIQSSVQQPIGAFGRSHLLMRNITETYTAFNYVMFWPFDKNCFENKCTARGQVGFLFDLIDDACYRAVFRVKRYKQNSDNPDKLWFHIHEQGTIDHREVPVSGGYIDLIVDLGFLSKEGLFWHLCLNIESGNHENMLAFYEATLEKLIWINFKIFIKCQKLISKSLFGY